VTATVVRASKPTSAKAGDSALVLEDGTVIGFVGGDCTRTSVQVQALATLDTGDPVLLRISPDAVAPGAEPQVSESGAVTVHNPCLSGGALEIFLEPSLPPALGVVHGDAPIARALRELAGWLGFEARAWDGDAPPDAAAVVVASHGGSEHAVIEAALRAGVPYIGLIASPRRGQAVFGALGLAPEDRARVRTPAGIDIGARTPQEVALAVLAEIVSVRPRPLRHPGVAPQPLPDAHDAQVATDPVCGMSVAAVSSSRHVDHNGVRSWFCGSGCQDAFRANPGAFVRR
jgi:xanthine dehydrogenase accessory factor